MLRENSPDAAKVEGRGVLNGWASMAEKGGRGQASLPIGGKDRKVVPVPPSWWAGLQDDHDSVL